MIRNIKTYLTISIIFIVAVLILGYSYYISRDVIRGPQITIDSPSDGETLDNELIEVTGNTKNASFLMINGRKVFTDDEGIFREKLLLSYGYNIIEVKAKDRFNRISSKKLQLLLK